MYLLMFVQQILFHICICLWNVLRLFHVNLISLVYIQQCSHVIENIFQINDIFRIYGVCLHIYAFMFTGIRYI